MSLGGSSAFVERIFDGGGALGTNAETHDDDMDDEDEDDEDDEDARDSSHAVTTMPDVDVGIVVGCAMVLCCDGVILGEGGG